ncbi:MAG TPA: HU family DNA-binding protein [Candidatus Acidoferrales bacterium]|nr:HU family DNA-binding protein [Candidatus Acidoferrales bacterium]
MRKERMTKPELIRELAEDFELPRRQLAEIVETILEKMTATLKKGEKVQLTPFGQFKVRNRPARMARNPQTGEPVKVPAKRVMRFLPSRALKEAVGVKRGASKAKGAAKGSAKKAAKKAPARKTAKRR